MSQGHCRAEIVLPRSPPSRIPPHSCLPFTHRYLFARRQIQLEIGMNKAAVALGTTHASQAQAELQNIPRCPRVVSGRKGRLSRYYAKHIKCELRRRRVEWKELGRGDQTWCRCRCCSAEHGELPCATCMDANAGFDAGSESGMRGSSEGYKGCVASMDSSSRCTGAPLSSRGGSEESLSVLVCDGTCALDCVAQDAGDVTGTMDCMPHIMLNDNSNWNHHL